MNIEPQLEINSSIEQMVNEKELTYIEAVVEYCEASGLEYEVIASQLSGLIKERIRKEATNLHLLVDQTTAELPL